MEKKCLLAIRIRSEINASKAVKDTLEMIRLQNSNHWEEPAICFQLYRPFLAVYTEAAAGVYGTSDGGQGLRDMNGKDVIRVGKWIAELEGETHFDILLNDRIMDQDLSNLVD